MDRRWSMHYVCTRDEARALTSARKRFWLSDCGCRDEVGGCRRSRTDVCLYFEADFPPTGGNWREIGTGELNELFREAAETHLVASPFRSESDVSRTDGICFCCDCCCGYFRDPKEACDKGSLIETTARPLCTDCGMCVDVCYFRARSLVGGTLEVNQENCYGCGLCVEVCPENCIGMLERG